MIATDDFAENAVLAACIESLPARKASRRVIDSADFLNPHRAAVWDAMSALDRDKAGVDFFTVHSALKGDESARQVVIGLTGYPVIPDHADQYANTVRSWAIRRRLWSEAAKVQQQAVNPDVDVAGLTSAVAARFAGLRDSGNTDDAQSITLGELMAEPDEEPDWVVPNFLERRDRFMLTGGEGLGKSYLLRQIAIMAASGLDPFDPMYGYEPRKVLIVDCENSRRQVRRKARDVVDWAQRQNPNGRPGMVHLLATGRIDILRDKDLAAIHREVDVIRPDIIVIGPIYAMSPKALMTDDDAVPVLAALDSLRETGAALLMEAHAGHAMGADGRNFRPRGSAALMGWPEFGYGLKPMDSKKYAELVPWRGDRDERKWPKHLARCKENLRWVEHDGAGWTKGSAGWKPASETM